VLHHLQDLPDHEVARAWRDILCRERDLSPAERRRCALERAYAWLALDDVDRILTSSFLDALETFPAEDAQMILDGDRDAAVHGLAYRDYERLTLVLPRLDLPGSRGKPKSDSAAIVPLAMSLLKNGVAAG